MRVTADQEKGAEEKESTTEATKERPDAEATAMTADVPNGTDLDDGEADAIEALEELAQAEAEASQKGAREEEKARE